MAIIKKEQLSDLFNRDDLMELQRKFPLSFFPFDGIEEASHPYEEVDNGNGTWTVKMHFNHDMVPANNETNLGLSLNLIDFMKNTGGFRGLMFTLGGLFVNPRQVTITMNSYFDYDIVVSGLTSQPSTNNFKMYDTERGFMQYLDYGTGSVTVDIPCETFKKLIFVVNGMPTTPTINSRDGVNANVTFDGDNTTLLYFRTLIHFQEATAFKTIGPTDYLELIQGMKIRYIRDWTEGSTGNNSNHWRFIKALDKYGYDHAIGVSPTTKTGYIPSSNDQATDGNDNTYADYGSAGGQHFWIQLDLGRLIEVANIDILHYGPESRTYHKTKTEVSIDGINWITIFDSAIEGEYLEPLNGKRHNLSRPSINKDGIFGANGCHFLKFGSPNPINSDVLQMNLMKTDNLQVGDWIMIFGSEGRDKGIVDEQYLRDFGDIETVLGNAQSLYDYTQVVTTPKYLKDMTPAEVTTLAKTILEYDTTFIKDKLDETYGHTVEKIKYTDLPIATDNSATGLPLETFGTQCRYKKFLKDKMSVPFLNGIFHMGDYTYEVGDYIHCYWRDTSFQNDEDILERAGVDWRNPSEWNVACQYNATDDAIEFEGYKNGEIAHKIIVDPTKHYEVEMTARITEVGNHINAFLNTPENYVNQWVGDGTTVSHGKHPTETFRGKPVAHVERQTGGTNFYQAHNTKIDPNIVSKNWCFTMYIKPLNGADLTQYGLGSYTYEIGEDQFPGNVSTTPIPVEDGYWKIKRVVSAATACGVWLVGVSGIPEGEYYIGDWKLEPYPDEVPETKVNNYFYLGGYLKNKYSERVTANNEYSLAAAETTKDWKTYRLTRHGLSIKFGYGDGEAGTFDTVVGWIPQNVNIHKQHDDNVGKYYNIGGLFNYDGSEFAKMQVKDVKIRITDPDDCLTLLHMSRQPFNRQLEVMEDGMDYDLDSEVNLSPNPYFLNGLDNWHLNNYGPNDSVYELKEFDGRKCLYQEVESWTQSKYMRHSVSGLEIGEEYIVEIDVYIVEGRLTLDLNDGIDISKFSEHAGKWETLRIKGVTTEEWVTFHPYSATTSAMVKFYISGVRVVKTPKQLAAEIDIPSSDVSPNLKVFNFVNDRLFECNVESLYATAEGRIRVSISGHKDMTKPFYMATVNNYRSRVQVESDYPIFDIDDYNTLQERQEIICLKQGGGLVPPLTAVKTNRNYHKSARVGSVVSLKTYNEETNYAMIDSNYRKLGWFGAVEESDGQGGFKQVGKKIIDLPANFPPFSNKYYLLFSNGKLLTDIVSYGTHRIEVPREAKEVLIYCANVDFDRYYLIHQDLSQDRYNAHLENIATNHASRLPYTQEDIIENLNLLDSLEIETFPHETIVIEKILKGRTTREIANLPEVDFQAASQSGNGRIVLSGSRNRKPRFSTK